MKKSILLALCMAAAAWTASATVHTTTFADEITAGNLATGEVTAIALGEHVTATFNKAGASSAPSLKSSGRLTMTMNSTLSITGNTEKIKITEVVLIYRGKGYMASSGSLESSPTGAFTYNTDDARVAWTHADGTNSVLFTQTMGAPTLTGISVTYTGAGSDNPKPEPEPEPEPDPSVTGDNLFEAGFATADDFARLSVVNEEDGSNTWRYDRNKQAVYILNDMGGKTAKDDYLVTPALQLYAGHSYRICFSASCENPAYPEKIAAYAGTEPTAAAMTTVLVPTTVIDSKNPVALSGDFTPEADGTYYMALHAASDPGMFYLYVHDFSVSRGTTAASPAEIADFTVTPASDGTLKATLALTAPSTTMDGQALTAPGSVNIKRNGEDITTLEAAPGQKLTYTDNVEAAGNYRYTATAVAESGKSYDAYQSVYVGMARPADPTDLTVTETAPGMLHFSWTPVTKNIYGHDIDAECVKYSISVKGSTRMVATDVTGSELDVQVVDPADPQEINFFTLKASTTAGEATHVAESETLAYGTPYAMPWTECFPNSDLTPGNAAEVVADPNHASAFWSCFETMINDDVDPVTADGGMLGLFAFASGDVSIWRTGKIHIDAEAANPYLTFYYFVWPGAEDRIEVKAGEESIFSGKVDGDTRGWQRVTLPLEKFKGSDVRLAFIGYCSDAKVRLAIDDIRVADELSTDLAVTRARIPYEMHPGAAHKVSIRIKNAGIADVEAYTLSLLEGDEVVATATGSLAADMTATHDFNVTGSLEPLQEKTYTVKVETEGDEDTSNNQASVTSTVADHYLAAPVISGFEMADGVLAMNWSAPVAAPRRITEGFEAYDEFVPDQAGEWSFIDADACPVIGIRDHYHGFANMFSPMAFMVFNNHDGFFPQIGTATFDAYEGGQCMMSAAVDVINSQDRSNDDWMISPRLSGEAQTVSFFARSSGMVFPENLEVMASSTDRLITSFQHVETFAKIPSKWTGYEVSLPAGTRYFALRNISYDQYMLFIDNVTFTAAPAERTLTGYEVYKAPTVEGPWTLLTDEALAPGATTHACAALDFGDWVRVRALYDGGFGAFSAPELIDVEAVANVAVEPSSTEAEYYDLRGIRQAGRPTAPGIYIELRGTSARQIVVK